MGESINIPEINMWGGKIIMKRITRKFFDNRMLQCISIRENLVSQRKSQIRSVNSIITSSICAVFLAGFLSASNAGTSIPFEIRNDTDYSVNITFSDRQNCLEPSLMESFIGKTINLPAKGGSWTVNIARRNGHGCNGENAVLFARAQSDGPSIDKIAFSDRERAFRISGDGGMWVDSKRTGLPGYFKQTATGQAFQWVLTEPLAPLSPDVMADLLRTYAPMVYLAEGEDYNPSSVEWAFPYLTRVRRGDKYWLYTKQNLDSPTDGDLDVFKGQGANATAYGFVVRKAAVYDLVYFTYYPYNRGKHIEMLDDSIFGNHVGDWENVVVRLDQNLNPTTVYLSQHDQGEMADWSAISKSAGTHPIVYAAAGSHGYYSSPGNHQYHDDPPLIDETSAGTAWDTQTNLVGFDFNAKKGVGGSNWPMWMNVSKQLSNSSPKETDPSAGPIYRWGNGENGCGGALKIYQDAAGACRLEDGPTGPIDKLERWDVSAHCLPGRQVSTYYQSALCD